ncbi:MAG: DMT family transporter, partial [candidate division Zixibacteria bacterium]|nr:DMT family transporter [candidate division Zixibacteria bacterium]
MAVGEHRKLRELLCDLIAIGEPDSLWRKSRRHGPRISEPWAATNIGCFPDAGLIYSNMQWASVYLLVCVIIWGWSFVATRVCLQYLHPVELLGLRFLIGLPVLIVVVLVRRVRFEFTGREWGAVLLGSAILTLHFLIQITGLQYTSATNTGWIIAVSPLVMAVLAYLILKERLGPRAIIGIAVASTGILLLVSRGKFASL